LCSICGNVWEAATSSIIEPTVGTDVRRLEVGNVVGEAGIVVSEIVGHGLGLVEGYLEVIRKSTSGGEEFSSGAKVSLKCRFTI
jgi:hypothetical protein